MSNPGNVIRFTCGHRRTCTNTTRRGTCRTCFAKALAKGRAAQAAVRRPLSDAANSLQFVDGQTWPRCGHPRTKETTVVKPRGTQCRICKKEWDQINNRNRPSRAKKRPVKQIPVTPPVQLYRDERAKRADRLAATVMAEAKAEYLARIEREKEASKGGRPKGSGRGGQITMQVPRSTRGKPQLHVQRSTDLCDLLEPYYGRSA